MFLGGIESRQSLQFARGGYPYLHSFINLIPRVVLEQPWLSQAIPRFWLVDNFFNRMFKNRWDSNSVSPISFSSSTENEAL